MATASDKQVNSIPGWFFPADRALFRFALTESSRQCGSGDLVEIGVYLGKSAVLVGQYLKPGETFTVIDLFGDSATDSANAAENKAQYPTLTRERFEANYLAVHGDLPCVVQAPSSEILNHTTPKTARFIHVDGSHLYEHVAQDIAASRELSATQGLVVFDDYRSVHTPGVSAAVWESLRDGLNPVFVSDMKLYATWGDPAPWLGALRDWLSASTMEHEVQTIAGREVFRLWPRPNALLRVLIRLDTWRRNRPTRTTSTPVVQ